MRSLATRAILAGLLSSALGHAQSGASQKLDADLLRFAARSPSTACAVLIVPLEGDPDIRVAGEIEVGSTFESWHLIPLGTHTVLVVDAMLADTLAANQLAWDAPVPIAHPFADGEPEPIEFGDAYLGAHLALPIYDRFVARPEDARPLAVVLERHAFLCDPADINVFPTGALRAALAQAALERAGGKRFSTLVREFGQKHRLPSLCDLATTWPARAVASGRTDIGEPWPVRLAEVSAAANCACALDDVARLAHDYLVDELAESSRSGALRPRTRFDDSHLRDFGIDSRRRNSRLLGTTLQFVLLPKQRAAIVMFANREVSDEFEPILDVAVATALGIELPPHVSVPRYGGRGVARDEPTPIDGKYHATVEFDDEPIEFEIRAASRRARWSRRGDEAEVSLQIFGTGARGKLSLPDRDDGSLVVVDLELRSIDPGGASLCGIASRVVRTKAGDLLERLPRPIRFDRR